MFEIADEAKYALDMLTKNGYEAYLVGGCVRDSVLGREFNDYDITTSAFPEEIKFVFSKYNVIETGIKHGTVTVLINGRPLEITTYRIDGEYSDNRHPEKVTFSRSLKDDLMRRDFTVNALAYNGKMVDLFGGIKDIDNRIIRCVGNPDTRFSEDGLRIMRALRFSSVLGFDIDRHTSDAIFRNMHLLKNISRERIYSELSKLLCGIKAGYIIEKYGIVFDSLFAGNDFSKRADAIDKNPDELPLRLAAFFLKDEHYREDYKSLKPDNNTYNRVCLGIENFTCNIACDKIRVKHFLRLHGVQNLLDVCVLRKAEGEDISEIVRIINDISDKKECYTVDKLNISGSDIALLGFKNKEIGVALNKLLDAVIESRVDNKKDKLIEYAKENIL